MGRAPDRRQGLTDGAPGSLRPRPRHPWRARDLVLHPARQGLNDLPMTFH
nr:MAG TPA: hypothetical protein [Caudoviricetes sp.]